MPDMPKPKILVKIRKLIFFVILIFDHILVIKVYNFGGNKNKNGAFGEEL
jgi:hypothetical protein